MLRDFRKVFKSSQGLTGGLMLILSVGLLAYLGTAFRTTHPDSPEVVLARVYGRDIRRREVNDAMRRMMQQFGQQDNMDQILPFIQQQALGQLMNLRLTEELADRHGVVVTDSELRDALAAELKSIPIMKDPKGHLLPTEEIKSILARYFNLSLKNFEDSTKSRLIMDKLYDNAAALVPVDEAWLEIENRVRNEKMSIEYVALKPDEASVADPGDEALETYLKASGDRFQAGARRVLQIVTIEPSFFGDSLAPEEEVLKIAYESKKNSYIELKASHILIRGTTPDEIKAAQEKILKIRARLMAGANFAKVAEEESEDPSAKANYGDLGWFRDGTMDKGFWDGAFALKKGEISGPVQSMYGLHLIKLEDRREKTFEEAKRELASEIANERFSAKAKERLEQLRKRAGGKGDLGAAAKDLGLKATLSEPFVQNATNVPGLEGVQYAAMEAFDMKVGQVSKVVSAPGRFLVYRVQKELPIAVPPLKEIRDKVLSGFRSEAARSLLAAKIILANSDLKSLGEPETKKDVALADISELEGNPRARQAILDAQVGAQAGPIWANNETLWAIIVTDRTPAPPLTLEKRSELIKDLQGRESRKLIGAELDDLKSKGAMRRGFNSLWGRINGIYINEEAIARGGRNVDVD
ncbi:MAG: peptidyl-prolyl cis-trans isomerase [Holophagales bacterium]|jgi:peptidyl-prolyl cis-trans isomerase D|nr:peptidyl-prolyl cis-trans isomerase [Holophagales bacterium]